MLLSIKNKNLQESLSKVEMTEIIKTFIDYKKLLICK